MVKNSPNFRFGYGKVKTRVFFYCGDFCWARKNVLRKYATHLKSGSLKKMCARATAQHLFYCLLWCGIFTAAPKKGIQHIVYAYQKLPTGVPGMVIWWYGEICMIQLERVPAALYHRTPPSLAEQAALLPAPVRATWTTLVAGTWYISAALSSTRNSRCSVFGC